MTDVAYAWAPITKTEEQDDGTLMVYGPAASSDLDRDQQRLNADWLDRAMPEWAQIGNIREQHDAKRAVGVGVGLSKADDGQHHIAAHIVDESAVKKIKAKVLKGFSVGIKNPKVVLGKADAPGGEVVDGSICEISVVDRPCNPNTLFEIAKADGAGTLEAVEGAGVVEKTDAEAFGIPDELYERLPDVVRTALTTLAAAGAAVSTDAVKAEGAPATGVVVSSPSLLLKLDGLPVTEDMLRGLVDERVSEQLGALDKADLSAAGRRKAAASGAAMEDGCLSAETLVATRSGPRRIDSLVGACDVLTDAGWVAAEIQSFGVKSLLAVTLDNGTSREVVYATGGHRWMLADGVWKLTRALSAGDRVPHVQVLGEHVDSRSLDSAERRVAGDTEKTSDCSGRMVMVDLKSSPGAARSRVGALDIRHSAADGAPAILCDDESIELGLGDSVLPDQVPFAAAHPSLVGNLDALGAPTGTLDHAEAAVGPAALDVAGVKVGVRAFDAASTADDRALVADGHADRGLARVLGSELGEPVLSVVPGAEPLGVMGLSAIGYGADSHTSHLTRSETWRVVKVEETGRVEEVFCAVVPDLHRFVLANGVLTGNSYPINTKADLRKAIKAVGRGNADHNKIRAHIVKRAKALGLEAMVPDNWNSDGSLKDANKADEETIAKAEHVLRDVRALAPSLTKADDGEGTDGGGEDESEDIAGAEQAIAVIAKLIIAEAESLAMGNLNEACDIDLLLSAVRSLTWFKQREEREQQGDGADMELADKPGGKPAKKTPVAPVATDGGGDDEEEDEDDDEASKSEAPTLTKADVTELVKSAVAEATKTAEERTTALAADLAKAQQTIDELKALPQPGGPVLTRTNTQEAEARKSDAAILRAQAKEFLAKADQCSDRYLADGYREKAAGLLAKADA